MKFPVKTTVAILVVGVGGFVAFPYARAWWKARNKPNYRQAAVTRGNIVSVVNATGSVQPVLRVQVGTFVSGPIRGPIGAAESLSADTTDTRITASYESATGVLTLSGPDSVENYERVLRTVSYNNTSETPNTTPRVITFVANDGTGDGNVGTATVTIVAQSGDPALDLDADDSSGRSGTDFATTFSQGGGPVSVADSDAVLSDVDDANLTSLTVTITNLLDDGKLAYYNQEVKKGELLAEIDPKIYRAGVARDQATLDTRKAEVERVEALLEQAKNDEERALALREMEKKYATLLKQSENKEKRAMNPLKMEQEYIFATGVDEVKFISDTELDQIKANRLALRAQLKVALATVEQARAGLENSEANLGYTKIRSPVDGIVIDRKIDEGQTLAAQFQTPELFVVAPDMREKMHVIAFVDEADIGLIREAKRRGQQVHFTVDAYPDDLFEGKIHQIRMNPTSVQNVVTYPVVVEAPNPELKLLPGMTATLSFEIDEQKDVLKIPNAALRFYPEKPEHVRPDDRKILEGSDEDLKAEDEDSGGEDRRSATQRAIAKRRRNRRHVWIVDGDYLKAVEIVTGLSDFKWTELVKGELQQRQKLVTRIAPPTP